MKNKILNVGEIRKCNTSYGNYCFDIEILNKKINNCYKSNLIIFKFKLKDIKNKRIEYLNKL